MFTYEYRGNIYYINIRNIAYMQIIDMRNILEIENIFETNTWRLVIYYTGDTKITFVYDTQEEAIELAEKLYDKNSSL